jgi:hypothetical protein
MHRPMIASFTVRDDPVLSARMAQRVRASWLDYEMRLVYGLCALCDGMGV